MTNIITEPNEFVIRLAQAEDVPHILSLATMYDLKHLSPDWAAKFGFLVSEFNEQDYQDFLGRVNHFYVLSNGQMTAGFLLAYSSDKIRSDEWLNMHIKSLYTEPFILIKQICVHAQKSGSGLASTLFQHLFNQVPGKRFFSVIVLEPCNHRSIAFHEKLGFTKVLEIEPPGESLRGVWMRVP